MTVVKMGCMTISQWPTRDMQAAIENSSFPTNIGTLPKPSTGMSNNNYVRPAGQNVDNFITDRPSSRVLAPPGGRSQFRFG
jgi:hypothetical protein